LTEVTATVKERAYYADRIDWAGWEASLTDAAARADDPSDTYGVVRGLLAQLDPHSGFESPAVARSISVVPERLPEREQPAGTSETGVGQLTLPFARWDPEDRLGARYVGLAWEVLAEPACGWIVDLRGGGGNAWTLLMALAPLLGEGPSFGFRYREGRTDTVSIQQDGALAGGGRPPVPSPTDPRTPEELTGIPVAIVQSAGTASAHEFALMAFAGRSSTRSFGVPTSGLPTAREGFEMSDGSVLHLTTALGVDRAGQAHEAALVPDVMITDTLALPPPTDYPDDALDAARAWLTEEAGCT
jgi:C-terminal processing protease CtpA/Prc